MLAYQIHGKGNNKIVLIHGFCENSTCFNEQVFFLQDHFEVITIDLPGVRNSPLIPGLTMEKAADAIHETLKSVFTGKCVMLGHSMGGYAVLAFAKKYASMLQGFGLIHSTAAADTPERRIKRDQAINIISEKGAQPYVRNFIPPLFSKEFTDKTKIDIITREAEQLTAESLIESLKAMKARPDSLPLLKQTTLPVLFVIGKQDELIPEKAMLEQAASCAQSSIVYLEHAAHMGMIENAEKCAAGIKTFADYCFS